MNNRRLVFALLLCFLVAVTITAQGTRLLRHPTVSRELVAFEYAGDLWVVSRSGGQARRLTATPASTETWAAGGDEDLGRVGRHSWLSSDY